MRFARRTVVHHKGGQDEKWPLLNERQRIDNDSAVYLFAESDRLSEIDVSRYIN
jgi:hypothetical protein